MYERKITETFKNSVSPKRLDMHLDMHTYYFIVHKVMKKFNESGRIMICKGQGSKPKQVTQDL